MYGLFGNMFFVLALNWKLSMLSGACTLAIMVLPLIIRSTEEALKSVTTASVRGSYGLGAGKLRTIFVIVLPPAISGILSGVLSLQWEEFSAKQPPLSIPQELSPSMQALQTQDVPFLSICIHFPTRDFI